jgi:integrase
MKPQLVQRNGKLIWTIDARSQKRGRFFGPTAQAVQKKYEDVIKGFVSVEFTDEDRLAKTKLQPGCSFLQTVLFWNARSPEKRSQSLAVAGAEWIADMKAQNFSKGFVNRCGVVLNQLKRFVGGEGKSFLLADLTSDLIGRFLGSFASVGNKKTVRSRLSHLLSFCLRKGWLSVHPIKNGAVPSVREARGRKAPPRIFSVQECKALLQTARTEMPRMIPYLALGLFCGIRPDTEGEMERMTAADIHLDAGMVEVPEGTTKTGGGRPVRLVQTVKRYVRGLDLKLTEENQTFAPAQAWLRIAPQPLVIVTDRYWRDKLCEKAGVIWSADVMRHTFASYHFYLFKNGTDTSEQMGHNQSITMLKKHYLQRVSNEAAAAFWQLTPDRLLAVMPEARAA